MGRDWVPFWTCAECPGSCTRGVWGVWTSWPCFWFWNITLKEGLKWWVLLKHYPKRGLKMMGFIYFFFCDVYTCDINQSFEETGENWRGQESRSTSRKWCMLPTRPCRISISFPAEVWERSFFCWVYSTVVKKTPYNTSIKEVEHLRRYFPF